MSDLKGKQLNYRGVKFRAWLYFMLFSMMLLTFTFAMQMFIFRGYYTHMAETEVEKVIFRVHADFQKPSYKDTLMRESFLIGHIYVFRMQGTLPVIIESGERGSDVNEDESIIQTLADAYNKLVKSSEDRHIYVTSGVADEGDVFNLVRHFKVEDEHIYYLVQTPYSMRGIDTSILTTQMAITTILSFVLSIVVSFLLSRKFAEPIADLTASAKKLAKGDYSVQFKSSAYSEIDDLAKTLNYATAEMKATDELRKDLIANISHELRTPLTMIKAYAEMIRDLSGDRPQKRAEHLQVILDETDRLAALVSDILDLSRIQAQTEEPDRVVFDVAQLVRDVCARFEGMYTPEGYTLVADIVSSAYVAADYKQIGQVVYNLVGNALNYVGDDKQIVVTLRSDGKKIRLSVADHGKGISPEDRERIWDRYFRSAESKRTKIGSGIGLSIVKGICDAHKLGYGVNSVLGEGSEFYVEFDAVEPL